MANTVKLKHHGGTIQTLKAAITQASDWNKDPEAPLADCFILNDPNQSIQGFVIIELKIDGQTVHVSANSNIRNIGRDLAMVSVNHMQKSIRIELPDIIGP